MKKKKKVSDDRYDQKFTIENGYQLGFAEYGKLDGIPLFHFHGTPSFGRLEGIIYKENAFENNIHLIIIDRPSYGLSDFQSEFNLLDWPKYVVELADRLGFQSFHVSGYSGGGPFALACAYKFSEKILSCSVIAGSYKPEINTQDFKEFIEFIKAGKIPPEWVEWFQSYENASEAEKTEITLRDLKKMSDTSPPSDVKYFQDPEYQQIHCQLEKRATVPSLADAMLVDWQIFCQFRPWNFHVKEIPSSVRINLYYGEMDEPTIQQGKKLAQELPFAKFITYPGNGHKSTLLDNIDEIFENLMLE